MAFASLSLLAPSLSAPAQAADRSKVECVVEKLKPALRAQIEADVARNFTEATLRPTYDDAVGSGLRIAAAECATENRWSEAAVSAARIYALAKLSLPIGEKFVVERGFNLGELRQNFSALSEAKRNRPLSKEDMQQIVIASVTDPTKQTRENALLLNKFFLILSTLQFAAWDFSQV